MKKMDGKMKNQWIVSSCIDRKIVNKNQKGKGHCDVYYTGPQSFIISFSYPLAWNLCEPY